MDFVSGRSFFERGSNDLQTSQQTVSQAKEAVPTPAAWTEVNATADQRCVTWPQTRFRTDMTDPWDETIVYLPT